MKEIEMKILEIPKSVVFEKMRRLGAKKKCAMLMAVKYFDFSDGRIHKKRDLLRLRGVTFLPGGKQKTELVYKKYKGVKKGCKVFDEQEFCLSGQNSFKDMSDFLERLGFVQTLYYEKKRTFFIYKNFKFEFDEHPKIPSLLEIEALNEKEVNRIIKTLSFEKYEKSAETIEQLMRRKYPKIRLNGLVF